MISQSEYRKRLLIISLALLFVGAGCMAIGIVYFVLNSGFSAMSLIGVIGIVILSAGIGVLIYYRNTRKTRQRYFKPMEETEENTSDETVKREEVKEEIIQETTKAEEVIQNESTDTLLKEEPKENGNAVQKDENEEVLGEKKNTSGFAKPSAPIKPGKISFDVFQKGNTKNQ